MQQKSLIFLVLAVAAMFGNNVSGFRVKFTPPGTKPDVDGYFRMPKNLQEASSLGFSTVPYRSDHGYDVTMSCYNGDVRVCVLFDKSGYAAGMQIAIPKKDVESNAYNIDSHMKLKSIGGQEYWTTSYYFESPETIKSGGRKAPVKDTIEGLWIENGNEIISIPLTETDLAEKTMFRRQNCFPGMGTHYYYDIRPDLSCQKLLPYFILVKNEKVIGVGINVFGQTQGRDRNWFENPPNGIGKVIVPSAPSCLGNLAQAHGIIALHSYFIDEPWNITC